MIIFPKFNNPTGFNKIGKDIYYIYIFTKVANFSGFIKNWENNKRYYLVWLRQIKLNVAVNLKIFNTFSRFV